MSAKRVASVAYTGNNVPVVIPLETFYPMTQITLVGCDSSNTTISVTPCGTTVAETVVVPVTTTAVLIDNLLINSVTVNVVAAGSYTINIFQYENAH